jgi:virginiamycin B lyase
MAGGSWRRWAIATIAAVAAFLTAAGAADAAVYWPEFGQVSRVNVDGSVFQEEFIPRPLGGGPSSGTGCAGIAATGSHLYWAIPAAGAIGEANLDGTEADLTFITGLSNPCGVAVDSTSVYWTEYEGGSIGRASLAGSEVERGYVAGLKHPCGVAVAGGSIYWTAETPEFRSYLARRPLAGGIVEDLYDTTGAGLCGVAIDAEHVYWGGFGESIGRAKLDGTEPEPSFVGGLDRPLGVALYGTSLYWSENDPLHRSIQTTELVGSHQPRTVLEIQRGVPQGIAVDSVVVPPPTVPATTDEFAFGKPHHGKHAPVTYVPLDFPQGGTFSVGGSRSVRFQVVGAGARPNRLEGAGRRLVKVTLARGRAGDSLRRRLAVGGKAWAAIRVRFRGADGKRTSDRERVSLVAPAAP